MVSLGKGFMAALLLFLFTTGCSLQGPQQKPQEPPVKQVQINAELAEKVKSTAQSVKGVEDSTTVVVNQEISTAIKVSGFDRFRLQSIKEEVHQKIASFNKGYTVYVTSDKKLFKLLQDLDKQIKEQQTPSLPTIKKKLDKINKDMHG
ncbi:YhcN/YlaJ family sporulation lipoprotein [Desulforamulus ruminis]|uniref:Sporulation lipoprotein YhcN/YlaJ-like protein n=1 Tax=Desulforamulus ruminis (strain ATCC 23193 / DSM 2154 / NCIMB 8452 / DL) TaxID=696281 RepID=F6DPW8_DESRL|nr:YhcN/YlaJ family sporulation lipoprotein [Desulforamulus ruminis]AEG60807.1 Sporulation lipoprotein YhcN/YlaJ-like protein [Desulforamulus ruminis DSM 2154]